MELKVWVEGIQRVVCGVCERTTCQDVVYALAHATGKTGRFTLIERWRNNERLLAPHEHPLKVLMKWGEYSSDVHFILQRTALDPSSSSSSNGNKQPVLSAPPNNKTGRPSVQSNKNPIDPLHGFTPPAHVTAPTASIACTATISPSKDLKKSLTFSGGRPDGNGLVRVSPRKIEHIEDHRGVQPKGSNGRADAWTDAKSPAHSPMPTTTTNDANQLVYPRYEPPYGRVHQPNANGAVSPVDHAQQDHVRYPPPYRNPPPPSSSSGTTPTKQIQPPPYREPPRPPSAGLSPYRSSPAPASKNGTPVARPPSAAVLSHNSPATAESAFDPTPRDDVTRRSRRHLRLDVSDGGRARTPSPPSDPLQAQLIQQVNRQRGSLDEQQERLVRLEQDLAEWEERLRRRLDDERQALNRELTQLEERCRTQESQLTDLLDVEGEWDRVCREGRELADELAKWRADVTLLDSQLDQCEPSVRSLRADLAEAEQRLTAELEAELNRVKGELDEAGREERRLADEDRSLSDELADSDAKVRALQSQIDQLTQEIKQANLQSLSIAPVDDLKIHLEGTHKPGHSRRMLGSPRQLENPVPTNKNPHGVWV